jgi:RNA polymerase sigma-70 factor (ECF subfamily)
MEQPSGEDVTRPSLLIRLRDHADAEAWRMFALTYAPLVYAYCRKKGLQDADAADVTQDVLKQVSQSVRGFTYDQEKGRFRDWLRTVARNKVLRFLGRKQNGDAGGLAPAEMVEDVAEGTADAEWADDFHAHILKVALEQIRPRFEEATWQAFERTWIAGAEPRTVATDVGLAIDQVYAAKSRVLKSLRAQILMLAEDLPPFVPLGE